jgi:hypothetical protein
MTIEQTVNIPESRRVYFDVPARVPLGKARITVQIDETAQAAPSEPPSRSKDLSGSVILAMRESRKDEETPHSTLLDLMEPRQDGETSVSGLLALRGTCEGEDTLDAYFERKRADKLIEIEHERYF